MFSKMLAFLDDSTNPEKLFGQISQIEYAARTEFAAVYSIVLKE